MNQPTSLDKLFGTDHYEVIVLKAPEQVEQQDVLQQMHDKLFRGRVSMEGHDATRVAYKLKGQLAQDEMVEIWLHENIGSMFNVQVIEVRKVLSKTQEKIKGWVYCCIILSLDESNPEDISQQMVRIFLAPQQPREISREEQDAIRREIEEQIGDFPEDDNYSSI